MCTICDRVVPELSADAAEAILKEIGDAMAKGKSAAHFAKVTDRLLGTEMEDRDRGLEALWEDGYRNGTD